MINIKSFLFVLKLKKNVIILLRNELIFLDIEILNKNAKILPEMSNWNDCQMYKSIRNVTLFLDV